MNWSQLRIALFVWGFCLSSLAVGGPMSPVPQEPAPTQVPPEQVQEPEESEESGLGLGGFGRRELQDNRAAVDVPEVELPPPPYGFGIPTQHPLQFEYAGLLFKFSAEKAAELNARRKSQLAKLRELQSELDRLEELMAEQENSFQVEIESLLSAQQLAHLTTRRLEQAASRQALANVEALLNNGLNKIHSSENRVLYEGVSRSQLKELDDQTLADMPCLKLSGNWFYEEPLQPSAERQALLLAICLDPQSYRPYRGGKFCGGFHADLAIEASPSGARDYLERVYLLVCFGCGEARLIDDGTELTFDLSEPAVKRLEQLAGELYHHRKAETERKAEIEPSPDR